MWRLWLGELWGYIEDFFIRLYRRLARRRSREQVGPRPDYEAIERLERELGISQPPAEKSRKKRHMV